MATQTYAALTNEQRNTYSATLLARFLPMTPMLQYGRKDSIPRREGKTIEWRGIDAFARATTPLTEGTPPSDTAISVTKVTATVAQYGAFVKMSDLLAHQGIDALWTEVAEALGEQAGQTIHTVLVNVLAAGTNVRYADGVAARINVAAANVMDAAETRRARRILAGANVRGFRGVGYRALMHPFTIESLTADSTVQSVAQYGAGGESKQGGAVSLLDGTVTRFGGFTIDESTDAPVFAGAGAAGIDVYGSLFFGPDWYGVVDLAAKPIGTQNGQTNRISGIEVDGVPVDVRTKDDPLGQFGVEGWKTWFGSAILQQQRGVRLEHAVAA